jgi:hypothetical protein
MEIIPKDEPKRLDRSRLLSFEQLTARDAAGTPLRRFLPFTALPVLPPVPETGAERVDTARREPDDASQLADLLIAQIADPCHRQPTRALSDASIPIRSRLSPSQRQQLRGPSSAREGRPYVTYTVDPRT